MSPRALSGLLAALLAGASSSLAAPAAPDKAQPPVFGAGVSLVSLPVFVTDKQGSAMRGLTAEDFEMFDDGKPVRVVSFQYVDTTSKEAQEEIRHAPSARRHFLFLFDLSFTNLGGLHNAQTAAHELIRTHLAESDLAAVATFDFNRGVRVVANFSEDRALLIHAVDTLGAPALAQISDPLGLAANLGITDIQTGTTTGATESNQALIGPVLAVLARRMREADDRFYRNQVMSLIGSLEELGKGLQVVEGRKQILYFSAGFDSRALVGLSGSEMAASSEAVVEGRIAEVDSITRYGDSRLRDVITQMTKILSSADCVVHSVDVTGLGADKSLTQMGVTQDSTRDTSGRESLHFMSAETGGRFFKDANDLTVALSEILDMTSRYYILGYQPEDLTGPGRFHKLKVKVKRKGSKVSHRAGFYEHVPRAGQTSLQRKFESAQLVMTGAGPNNLVFSALCLPFPSAGDRQMLGVVVQIPKSELPWDRGRPMALEVYGYAVGKDGTVVDHLAQLARIDPAQADPQQTALGLSFYGAFRVPPGQYTIKLMAQEAETGSSGAHFIDVTVPPHDPRVGFLLPPVLMEDSRRWLGLDLSGGKVDRAFPFAVAGLPFLPRTSFLVKSGTPEKLVLMAWAPERPQDPVTNIEIQSSVTDAKGTSLPGGPIRLEKINHEGAGRRTYVLNYTPEGLAPGDYTLRIGIGESGTRLESYAPLRVGPTTTARQ